MKLKYLDHLEEWLIAALMGAATLLIFISVVHRYVSGISIPHVQDWLLSLNFSWSQELCIYLFIWMAKFGAAYGVRVGVHVGIDVLVNRLPLEWRKYVILFSLGGGMVFTGTVASLGAYFVWHMAHTQQTSADLELPMWIVYLAIPLGSSLMCFRFLQAGWQFIHGTELAHYDVAHVDGLEEAAAAQVAPVNMAPVPAQGGAQ
jgi:C4-dicarboxylate transporter DctQ subunit